MEKPEDNLSLELGVGIFRNDYHFDYAFTSQCFDKYCYIGIHFAHFIYSDFVILVL